MEHDRRLHTPHYLRGIFPLARAVRSDAELRLAPGVSITDDLIRSTWKTTHHRNRIAQALFKSNMIDYADVGDEIAYGWTPLGKSLAVAARSARAGEKSIMLYDWLQAMPQDMIVTLCNLPSETVPEWAPLTNELRLTLTRTQTKRFSLRDLTPETLIDFFTRYPHKTPRPSDLTYADLTRVPDIAARDRLHAALTRIRNHNYGVAPELIAPEDFDWEYDYNRMILDFDF